jgi:hypothetical protein
LRGTTFFVISAEPLRGVYGIAALSLLALTERFEGRMDTGERIYRRDCRVRGGKNETPSRVTQITASAS